MSRTILKVIPLGANPTTANSATIATQGISEFKEFDITIRCSSSTGFAYKIYTGPTMEDAALLSQTGGTFTAGTCATLRHKFINNNQFHMVIKASASAIVSASHVNIYLTSVERF